MVKKVVTERLDQKVARATLGHLGYLALLVCKRRAAGDFLAKFCVA